MSPDLNVEQELSEIKNKEKRSDFFMPFIYKKEQLIKNNKIINCICNIVILLRLEKWSEMLKKTMLILLICLLVLFLIYAITVRCYPSFGGDVTAMQKAQFEKLQNFKNGKFVNRKDVPEKLTFTKFIHLANKYLRTKVENGFPVNPIETLHIAPEDLIQFQGNRMFWFGHSTFLIQNNGINILIDPMFGNVPAPLDFLGNKRFSERLPIDAKALPEIDYVVFSHDHYDHLDYESVIAIKDKVGVFIVPLGLGNHLIRWGVRIDQIKELNWWQTEKFDDISFVCTPAQHFSGRKFNNGQQTLWSSWVIKSASLNLYFSGDSGYDIHFKEIGERYGPFDISLLECGQYNKLWPDIHMFPNQTVQAGIDLKSKKIIPIHWGAFKLAMHPWNEPAIEVLKESERNKVNIQIPKIGQQILIDTTKVAHEYWWDQF